jgi:hypothetical protein
MGSGRAGSGEDAGSDLGEAPLCMFWHDRGGKLSFAAR